MEIVRRLRHAGADPAAAPRRGGAGPVPDEDGRHRRTDARRAAWSVRRGRGGRRPAATRAAAENRLRGRRPPYIPGVLETIGYEPEMAPRGPRPPTPRSAGSCGSTAASPRCSPRPDRTAPASAARCWPGWRPTRPRGRAPGDWCVLREWPDHRAHPRAAAPAAYRGRPRRPPGSRAAARCCAPTSTWRPSSSRCTRSPAWPRSSGWWHWPGRAGRDRWSCSPRRTSSTTPTWSPRTWPTRRPASRWWWSAPVTGRGIDELRERLDGRLTMALLGPPGTASRR